ncbi:MAG: hypothetical protein HUJ30_08645, partial [Gammaproteobacteria bacterium]|nr:hypothetical protein [Gammaproteobacteria bacterium]
MLIQNRPRRFRLDKNERFQFFWKMEDKDERLGIVEEVLDALVAD